MGSPPVPKRALNGTPSLALKIPLNCHPFVAQVRALEPDLRPGTTQVPLRTRVRRTSKSDKPRLGFKSNHQGLEMVFEKVSPTRLLEFVSMLLPQVNEP